MSCVQHREAVALLAGGDLARTERAAVEAHLQECPACLRLLEEFRTGVMLLKADPAVALPARIGAQPIGARRRRRPLVAGVAAAAALFAASLLHPQVRLAVAAVLHLPAPRVREQVITWRLPGGKAGVTEYVDADYVGTDYRVDPGPGVKVESVQAADEARRLVGQSVLLPPREGTWCADGMIVEHVTDQQGVLKYAHVESCAFDLPPRPLWASAGAALYDAQYWPGRPTDKSSLVFGANWQVTTRDQTIGGRSARIIEAKNRVTGDYHSELWLQDGDWLYKLRNHNPEITTDMLVDAANALR